MDMTDEQLQHLVTEIEDYWKKMEKAEVHMKSSSSAFMAAHSATMEVLGVAGKVKYHEKFSRKVREMPDACFVQWYSIAVKQGKNIYSVGTGQYLKLL